MKSKSQIIKSLNIFTRHYLIAALWSGLDDENEPLDSTYSIEDFTVSALLRVKKECEAFLEYVVPGQAYTCEQLIRQAYENDLGAINDCDPSDVPMSKGGHDFSLTRNHHGVGFWDRGHGKLGQILTEAAHHVGECHIYVHRRKLNCEIYSNF